MPGATARTGSAAACDWIEIMPRPHRVASVALLTSVLVLTGCSKAGAPSGDPSASSTPASTSSSAGPAPSETGTATATATGTTQAMKGKSGTFTVVPPTGWRDASDQVGSVQGLETVLVAGEKTGSFSNNLVVVSVPGNEQTARDELAKGKDGLKQEGRTLTEVPEKQVAGVTAAGFGAAFEQQGVKVLARSWAAPHGDRVYLLTLSSSQEDADHAMAQFDQLLSSWQWT